MSRKWLATFSVMLLVFGLLLEKVAISTPELKSEDTEYCEVQKELTSFEKEAIASIREIVPQLIFIATGVLALVGGLLALRRGGKYRCVPAIYISLALFAISAIFGLLAYGSLIFDLLCNEFHSEDSTMRFLACYQWGTFLFAILLLVWFFIRNVD